jgi:hypothetical protein
LSFDSLLTAARSAESAFQFLIGLASLLCLHKFFPPCFLPRHAGNLSIFSPTNGVLLHYEEIICPNREIESMTQTCWPVTPGSVHLHLCICQSLLRAASIMYS